MARIIIITGPELKDLEGVFQRYIGNIISTDMVCNSEHVPVQQIELVFNNQLKIFIKVIHPCQIEKFYIIHIMTVIIIMQI